MQTTVTTPDNRRLEVRVDGAADGPVVLYHHGAPGAPVDFGPIADAAAVTGTRVVSYARPGYATSTEHRGRRVGDAAADSAAVMDALGVSEFVAIGTSGGGPHALACAALRPDRCRAAATVAGLAPYDGAGLDWRAGMGPENIEEFEAATQGFDALIAYLARVEPHLARVTPAEIVDALSGLLPAVDRAALDGRMGEFMAASFHRALVHGISGWRDDDLAFVTPWGFEPAATTVPVAVWQGDVDLMVPATHGAWLAGAIPTARAHLLADHGHVTLSLGSLPEIIADLVGLAGW